MYYNPGKGKYFVSLGDNLQDWARKELSTRFSSVFGRIGPGIAEQLAYFLFLKKD